MAQAVLAVINLWAQIEFNYAAIVARIAKADPVTVTVVFQAMISLEAREAALIAAANERLSREEASLIRAVLDTTKASRRTRNTFAHHLWGSLGGRPDCVILVDPKILIRYTARLKEWDAQGTRPELDRSQVIVWRQRDLDLAADAARVAHDRIVQLSFTFDHPAADHRRQSLLADDQIARRYSTRFAETAPQTLP